LVGRLFDHQESLAVDGHVIGRLIEETPGHVRPVDDLRWAAGTPLGAARLGTHSHQPAVWRHIKKFLAAARPDGPRAAGRRDLHCPALRGASHETTYFVGNENDTCWKNIARLSELLERLQSAPPLYRVKDNMPYGVGWNKPSSFTQGLSFGRWALDLPGNPATSTLEISYANSNGTTVTAAGARVFGRDLARAIRAYFQ